MILLRNCPHDNGIITYRDDELNIIIKSSYSQNGIKRLRQEYDGYLWYIDRENIHDNSKLNFFINHKESYCRLIISIFLGEQGEHSRPLHINREKIHKAIKKYVEIWPKDRKILAPLHGDLSLGNMIFQDEKVLIIDWEHYQYNAAPWGFDLVNMLYESTLMSMDNNGNLSEQDIIVFREARETISKLLYDQNSFKCNFEELVNFYTEHCSIWQGSIAKFPVMNALDNQRRRLALLDHI